MSGAPRGRGRSRAKRLLRLAIGVATLALVLWTVPWSDRLIVGGERYAGVIEGEWKAERVRFRFAPAAVPAGSPLAGTAAESAIELGAEVAVSARALESPRWRRTEGGALEPAGPAESVDAKIAWRPGMPRAFADLEAAGLVPAIAFAALASLFAATRWWRLLALAGCVTRWAEALRLTYIGLFFNLVLPGLNGGDLARAVLAVRASPARRADALMSVIVDRLIGLIAMIALAAFAVLAGSARFSPLRWVVLLTLAGLVAALALFLNPPLRRLARFERVVARLPQGERLLKLDRALADHVRAPAEMLLAFVLSLGNHLFVAAQIHVIAHAFGGGLAFLDTLGVVTIANTLSSLPTTPGGIGVGEAAYGSLFALLGSAGSIGVATSITYRLTSAALSLVGGIFLVLPAGRDVRAELARADIEIPPADGDSPPSSDLPRERALG